MEARPVDALASRALDLARLGADAAATAYGALLGREIQAAEPVPVSMTLAEGEPAIGVVFELEGDLAGFVVLMLHEPARRRLIQALCGELQPDPDREASALREAGNILASRAVSAVADHLGARITISIPTVVSDDAETALRRMIAKRAGVAAESQIEDEPGCGGVRLVFAPDAPSRF